MSNENRFLGLIKGIQNAGKSGGYSIVKIIVLVDERGFPILYPSMEVKRLSPLVGARVRINEILKSIAGDTQEQAGWKSVEPPEVENEKP